MKKIKSNEKGSITLFVVLSMMTFLIIVTGIYTSSSNNVRKQESQIKKIQQEYEQEDANDLYEEYVNTSSVENEEVVTVANAVAAVENTYYASLQEAIEDVSDEDSESTTTMTLLDDTSENIPIEENQNVILDLNEHTITNEEEKPTITSYGFLTLIYGNIIGNYDTRGKPTIYVGEHSILNLYGSNIDRNGRYDWETIQVYGDLNVNFGSINSDNNNAICSYQYWNPSVTIGERASVDGEIVK